MDAVKTFSRTDFDDFIAGLAYPPNRFQLQVLESVAFGSGNIIVDAKAGSGKTSLLKMIASLLKSMGVGPGDVLFQAFNKTIETELNEQLPKGFKARTSHSLGLAMAREYAKDKGVQLGRISSKKYRDIAESIAKRLYPSEDEKGERFKAMIKVQNLIGKIMANDVDPQDQEAVIEIAEHYGIDDVTGAMLSHIPDAIQQVILRFEKYGEMDFIDMIYMPVKLRLQPQRKLKYVLVDESQDLNSLQQEISDKMLHPEGRIILVGDPRQAIYGFAGADAESFKNLTDKFDAKMLELNICYRCPTTHIRMAQTIVPSIEAAPNAIEGEIKYEHLDTIATMTPGSMVICRLNAPLISAYFQFIAKEKPAAIIGRSMGKGLIDIIDRAADVPNFRYRDMGNYLNDHFKRERERLEKKPNSENKIAELSDSIDCLQVCLTNFDCHDLDCFKEKLDKLFVDSTDKEYDPKAVVTLCTVHRAKGLESDEIGIIYQRPQSKNGQIGWQNIMPLTWENQRQWEAEQEQNIIYVAYTRAKKVLRIFGGYKEGYQPPLFDDEDETLLTIQTIDPETGEADEIVPAIALTESSAAEIVDKVSDDDLATNLPPRKPVISELVKINPEHNSLDIFHRALAIAQRLLEAGLWDGETVIRFDDAYTTHNRVMGIEKLPLEELILTEENGEILVTLPADNAALAEEPHSPASEPDEIPEDPQAWAKYVLEHKDKFVILDTETTDLQSNRDNFEIVQLSIIDIDGNVLYSSYIKPRRATISAGAASVHGISDKQVARAGFISMEWDKIEPHIKGKHIIAYNAPFDEDALENSLLHCHRSLVKNMDVALEWHCAMRMYSKHNQWKIHRSSRGGWWKLTEALQQQRLAVDENAHDALADVRMTLELIKSMASDPENRWANKQGYMPRDLVKIRASGKVVEVISTLPSGEVNVKSLEDEWRGTFDAGLLDLVQAAHERRDGDYNRRIVDEVDNHDMVPGTTVRPADDGKFEITKPAAAGEIVSQPAHSEKNEAETVFQQGDLVKTRNGRTGTVVRADDSRTVDVKTVNGIRPHYPEHLERVDKDVQPKPLLMVVPNTPKQSNPYDQLEALVRQFDSPDDAQKWIDVIQEMVTVWKSEVKTV